MKKFLIVFGAVGSFVCIGMTIFLITFNVDRYRPLVIQKMEEMLGKPVKLERLGVGWHGGIAVELNKLAVYPDRQAKEASIEAGKIVIVIHLLPLLKKQVEISSVFILQSRLHILREKNSFQVEGVPPMVRAPGGVSGAASDGRSRAPGGVSAPTHEAAAAGFWTISVLEIKDGTIHLTDSSSQPPLDVTIRKLDATVKNLSLTQPIDFHVKAAVLADEQNISFQGQFQRATPPKGTVQLKMEGIPLDSAILNPSGAPQLKGKLSGSFDGTFSGLTDQEIRKTFTGQGRFQLKDGAILHLNILREIFSKLSIIPGLVEILESRLSDSYKEKLKTEDTVLRSVDLPFIMQEGQFLLNNVQIVTDTLELTGNGRVGLDGEIAFQVQTRVEPQLSAAMVSSVKELNYLTDDQGRLQIPVVVRGTPSRIAVLPDVSYVATHLGMNKAEELVGTLLQRFLEKKGKQSGAGS